MAIKVNLKSLLKERKMTMTQLHQLTGISMNALSLFSNLKSSGIQYSTIEKITNALDVGVGDLIEVVDNVFELVIEDCDENDYEEMFNLKDLDIEKGLVLHKSFGNEKENYNFNYKIKLKDINNDTTEVYVKTSINYNKTSNSLWIKILKIDLKNSSIILNNITHLYKNTYNGFPEFYYIVSHLIVNKIISSEYFKIMNIYWEVIVDWRYSGEIPDFYYDDRASESLSNNNDALIFVSQLIRVNLVPKDPKAKKELLHEFNLDIPYIANLDHLTQLKLVHNVEIDEATFKRTVYIS
ncbi:helix-turn-helix domain-containing protein [Savagea sp. SN6]|uniref:Helix-turn-helix domain-containing protein n=1 Tax=Savagea serpentis TaxID=2785297 RepID=A0A8J7GAX8_9BACL|nr:helix-turn-helix domain-containing protein [Savagea serpentis]MBF4501195.1 helix-turn-helix domain-containing protein [Savagea serpentis]